MNSPQWVVDAVLKQASALTLSGRCQVSALRKTSPLNFVSPDTSICF
jgi:hypothetical protein